MKLLSNLTNVVSLVIFVCSFVGCATAQKDPEAGQIDVLNLSILPTDTSAIGDFHAEASCSDTKLRTVVATLTWRADKSLFDNQRLDVTFYKKGFEKSLYTSLWPLKKDQKFQTSGLVKLPERADNEALYLDVKGLAIDRQTSSISVELEGLESGRTYFWRVCTLNRNGWVPGGVVPVEAPVCPADMIEEPNQRL